MSERKGENNYKFRSLEVYCSTEWMHNDTKRYRTVFDRSESGIIYAELSFFNKRFDEYPWSAKINLRLTGFVNDGEIGLADVEETRTISPGENIVQFNKGCGYDVPDVYWLKGKYRWDGYIDGIQVGSRFFYINDAGKVTDGNNPYFIFKSLKVFEGGKEVPDEKNRNYPGTFSQAKTRFVWSEFILENLIEEEWYLELFFHYRDSTGLLKGVSVKNCTVESGKKNGHITVLGCCGDEIPGGWKDKKYTVEVVFMDTLIATVGFTMGTEEVSADREPGQFQGQVTIAENEPGNSLNDYIGQLNELIGLSEIKQQIQDQLNYLEFLKIRKERGFEDEERINLNTVFTGNPGTGKTTVVKLLGKIYHKMGLLPKATVTEVNRNDLVAEYVGQTAPKVMKVIEQARGGILFIDEAYALARADDDGKDFGKEVVEILIREMSDGPGNLVVMVAGYPKEMETFIRSNPGLKSRFNHYFRFPDYTPEELLAIFDLASAKRNLTLDGPARELVRKEMTEAYRTRDSQFGNARYVWGIVDEAKMNMGIRLVKQPDFRTLPKESYSLVLAEDVERIFSHGKQVKIKLGINEELLAETMAAFNDLTGLSDIRNEVHELVKLARYYDETDKNVLNKFSLHTVFVGNPGTGKTTVARLMGKLFKALGLLEKGHLVECDRESLVAGYVGQTAIKTREKIDEALGGVLFIDEAYALAEGTDGYGNEAVEVILKRMEDFRGKLAVIVAGYPDNMEQFLLSNPGLKSRFDRYFRFPDYTAEELSHIAVNMFLNEGYKLDEPGTEHFRKYLKWLVQTKDSYFGNARTMRNIVQGAIRKQNLRMAEIPADQRAEEILSTITVADLADLKFDQDENTFDPVPE